MPIMNLSKSLYTKGIQCSKSLWLKQYKPEILIPPDSSALARLETGKMVGELACELFPGGKKVQYNSQNTNMMVQTTQQWIDEGYEYIYEATFIYDGILIMVDILRKTPDGLEIYEVKSSTSVKDIHLHDVAVQQFVLENLGYKILNTYLVHINSSYVRGDKLDLHGLFSIVNVTADTEALQIEIPDKLREFNAYLSDQDNEPNIDIGKHCKYPYECDAKEYCWKIQRGIPDYSIFNIFNIGSKKQIELYEQGIVKIENIPDSFNMTPAQKLKVVNWKKQTDYIDKESIKNFLDTLSHPIYHLDFETFQQAIPQWKGISPYQQIPFQYSLHIEHSDGTIEHKEYLAEDGADPQYTLAKRLVKDIPEHATVLAYNMSFETGVIDRLAADYHEFSEHLLKINKNMHDLMIPFQQNYYITPQMQGSYSIKYILPALVPEMQKAYKELNGIHNGSEAMNAFSKLSDMKSDEKQKTRKSLLAYCKLDTLAMVKILKKLREVAKQ